MLSNLYNKAVAYENDVKFMIESVISDPIENPEGAEVDVDSVPQSAVDRANSALDQIVGHEDYDDTELEELLGDDDDDTIDGEISVIIEEAVSEMDDLGNN